MERISQNRDSAVHYYVADGQGSIRSLTDTAGNVTDVYYYSAFGEEIAKSGTTENEFRYTGEQWDPNAGFYYLRARWYNASTGLFPSVDPYQGIHFSPLSLHRYLYSRQSPINFRDPTGEFSMMECMVTIAALNCLNAYLPGYFHSLLKKNTAYFAERPLFWSFPIGDLLSPLVLLDFIQIEPVHEQIFFNDGKPEDNVGFFNSSEDEPWFPLVGIGKLKRNQDPKMYRKTLVFYNPERLRKAVDKVSPRFEGKKYILFGYNCQDFAQAVRMAY